MEMDRSYLTDTEILRKFPQRSILGSVLCIMFLNDMPRRMPVKRKRNMYKTVIRPAGCMVQIPGQQREDKKHD